MKVLVTGAAGFIGFHLTRALLERGDEVIGVDNLNDYYDPQLKQDRLDVIGAHPRANAFTFLKEDIADRGAMSALFANYAFDTVVNLAAQAGVRYSLENPNAYVDSNLVGFVNILEGCRHSKVGHLVYASSSSVYGMNVKQPFSVEDRVDHPISLYAATKKSNELMAHTYSHLYGLPTTGLRFFTVYGPWGRPDMSPWIFTSAVLEGRPIKVFNHGKMQRDFTFISDIVDGTVRVIDHALSANSDSHIDVSTHTTYRAPYRVFNIGSHTPVELMTFIKAIETATGKTAIKMLLPMQPGDVVATFADIEDLRRDVGFEPRTSLEVGVKKWAEWYESYANGHKQVTY